MKNVPPGLEKKLGRATECDPQFASWSASGSNVVVHVNPSSSGPVDVTVEAAETQSKGESVAAGNPHDFTFNLPPGQVKHVQLRVNEGGCSVAQQ